jgi:hypothetical protein
MNASRFSKAGPKDFTLNTSKYPALRGLYDSKLTISLFPDGDNAILSITPPQLLLLTLKLINTLVYTSIPRHP